MPRGNLYPMYKGLLRALKPSPRFSKQASLHICANTLCNHIFPLSFRIRNSCPIQQSFPIHHLQPQHISTWLPVKHKAKMSGVWWRVSKALFPPWQLDHWHELFSFPPSPTLQFHSDSYAGPFSLLPFSLPYVPTHVTSLGCSTSFFLWEAVALKHL